MYNNKGQSLVLFVLIIPIILLLMMLVFDIGKLVLLKQELSDINYIALDYGVDNLELDGLEDKMKEIININKDDIDNVSIDIMDNKICITLEESVDTTFSLIKNLKVFKIKSAYCGYIENEKTIIERKN